MPKRANGVVSLLDGPATEAVRAIWKELDERLGLRGISVMPYPHFSYHIAGGYDRVPLEEALESHARRTGPFPVQLTGVETFSGEWPVVFLAVAPDRRLLDLHQALWGICSPHAQDESGLYAPGRWVPHVSLAYGDEGRGTPLSAAQVRDVLAALQGREVRRTVTVDNLALVADEGTVQRPVRTFPLRSV